jgi:hypothetical protein
VFEGARIYMTYFEMWRKKKEEGRVVGEENVGSQPEMVT